MYPKARYEVKVVDNADLNALGDKGDWAPGAVPHIIRGVYVHIVNDIAAVGRIKVDKRPTMFSDAGRGDGDVATINLVTAHTGGKVVYKDDLNVRINPGQQIVVEVDDVTGAGDLADVVLDVERLPEVPGNVTAMVATT